jgi:membrane protease YdiL (CAAX protease family)
MLRLRAPSWPVWLIGIGGLLVTAGAISALWAIGPGGLPSDALFRPNDLPRAIIALILAGTLGALVLIVGLFAFVVRGATSPSRAEQGYASIGTMLACFAVAVIVANLLTVPYGIAEAIRHPGQPLSLTPGVLVLSIVALDLSLLGVVYYRIIRPGVLTWEQLGLTSIRLADRIRIGIFGGVAVVAVSAVIEQVLNALGVSQTQVEMFGEVKTATLSQFVGVLLAVAVVAPICEEIFFRGYVFTAIQRTRGLPLAFASSSVLFAVSHLNLQAFLPILVIGIGLCFLYWRTTSLVPSIVAHMLNNAVALSAFYFSG